METGRKKRRKGWRKMRREDDEEGRMEGRKEGITRKNKKKIYEYVREGENKSSVKKPRGKI